jgi:glycerol-1-phosphate dehydrogenase [NAD(P)+]
MLSGPPPVLAPDTDNGTAILERYGPELSTSISAEFAPKRLDRGKADELNDKLAQDWGRICERLSTALLPRDRIEAALRAAGAPLTSAEIGLERSFYEQAMLHSREIRNRFTLLVLAVPSGRMASLLPTL